MRKAGKKAGKNKENTSLLSQFSQGIIRRAANKILLKKGNHIFHNKLRPKPYLHGIVHRLGGRRSFLIRIIGKLNGKVPTGGFFEQTITLCNQRLTVRGFVQKGIPMIDTIFK